MAKVKDYATRSVVCISLGVVGILSVFTVVWVLIREAADSRREKQRLRRKTSRES